MAVDTGNLATRLEALGWTSQRVPREVEAYVNHWGDVLRILAVAGAPTADPRSLLGPQVALVSSGARHVITEHAVRLHGRRWPRPVFVAAAIVLDGERAWLVRLRCQQRLGLAQDEADDISLKWLPGQPCRFPQFTHHPNVYAHRRHEALMRATQGLEAVVAAMQPAARQDGSVVHPYREANPSHFAGDVAAAMVALADEDEVRALEAAYRQAEQDGPQQMSTELLRQKWTELVPSADQGLIGQRSLQLMEARHAYWYWRCINPMVKLPDDRPKKSALTNLAGATAALSFFMAAGFASHVSWLVAVIALPITVLAAVAYQVRDQRFQKVDAAWWERFHAIDHDQHVYDWYANERLPLLEPMARRFDATPRELCV